MIFIFFSRIFKLEETVNKVIECDLNDCDIWLKLSQHDCYQIQWMNIGNRSVDSIHNNTARKRLNTESLHHKRPDGIEIDSDFFMMY